MKAAADWIGRTLLLVLAGLATLSLIASMAAVSNIHDTPSRAPGQQQASDTVPVTPARPAEPVAQGEWVPVESPAGEGILSTFSASDPDDGDIARWLESLTYAVMALAGFMAAAVIVLLRITALLARIAEQRSA